MGVRRDWYQSNEKIILALLIKGTSDVTVEFFDQSFSCSGLDKGNRLENIWALKLLFNERSFYCLNIQFRRKQIHRRDKVSVAYQPNWVNF